MTPRQRVRANRSPLRRLGAVPLALLALAFVWYGAMVVLLAVKVSPDTVNAISGYRTAYDVLNGVGAGDIGGGTRLATGLIGAAAFLVFSWLALKSIARPYLARSSWTLAEDGRGTVVVEPRAFERIAEGAARENPAIVGAAGRYAQHKLVVAVELGEGRGAPDALTDVRRRVRAALARHGLPLLPVEVRLTGYQDRRRELT